MKTSATSLSCIFIASSLFSCVSAAPFKPSSQPPKTRTIGITFSRENEDGATTAVPSIGVRWPVDNRFYVPNDVATQFPVTINAGGETVTEQPLSMAEEEDDELVRNEIRITCTFFAVDRTTWTVNNWPTKDGGVKSSLSVPTMFTSGECHEVS